jgi:cell division transport system permease protein
MNRVRLLVSEAFRSIFASASTTVAATVTVLIGMFVLGLAIALGTWVISYSNHVQDEIHTKIYFCPPVQSAHCPRQATPAEIAAVARRLKAMPELVKSYTFVSRQQAWAIMQKRTPELTQGSAYNPLPASFDVTPVRAVDAAAIVKAFTPLPAGVQEAKYGDKTARRVIRFGKIVSIVFLVAVIILLAASTLLIANTIRLSIFARRREIEVMKLVGATNWFVRGPFMIEGLICGFVGSVAAIMLLLIAWKVALPAIHIDWGGNDARSLGFELNALILLGAGLLLGAAGSGLTLRRFLRV